MSWPDKILPGSDFDMPNPVWAILTPDVCGVLYAADAFTSFRSACIPSEQAFAPPRAKRVRPRCAIMPLGYTTDSPYDAGRHNGCGAACNGVGARYLGLVAASPDSTAKYIGLAVNSSGDAANPSGLATGYPGNGVGSPELVIGSRYAAPPRSGGMGSSSDTVANRPVSDGIPCYASDVFGRKWIVMA